jgi:thiol-disulfide isomerase/thioredoxin
MKTPHLAVMLMITMLAGGCAESRPTTTTGPDDASARATTDGGQDDPIVSPPDADEPDAAETSKQVQLKIKTWGEVQAWVGRQQGKVVVVDVWSTFCEPCIEEFPQFVELHNQFADEVACASVDIDYYGAGDTPEEIQPRVLEFLTKHRATSVNFISSTADEEVLDSIGIAAIPAVLVYDQTGKLKKTFTNDNGEYGPSGFRYAKDINPFVEELLR